MELLGVSRSTFRHWRSLGLVSEGPGGTYDEGAAIDAVLLATLRDQLGMENAAKVWRELKRSGEGEQLVTRARKLDLKRRDERFDLVIEPSAGIVSLATDDASLVAAVRDPEDPRPVTIVPLASRLRRVRRGFNTYGDHGPQPQERVSGRPQKSGTVTRLHGRSS